MSVSVTENAREYKVSVYKDVGVCHQCRSKESLLANKNGSSHGDQYVCVNDRDNLL